MGSSLLGNIFNVASRVVLGCTVTTALTPSTVDSPVGQAVLDTLNIGAGNVYHNRNADDYRRGNTLPAEPIQHSLPDSLDWDE